MFLKAAEPKTLNERHMINLRHMSFLLLGWLFKLATTSMANLRLELVTKVNNELEVVAKYSRPQMFTCLSRCYL